LNNKYRYRVITLPLDTAVEDFEVVVSAGAFYYEDGNVEVQVKFDDTSNDPIPWKPGRGCKMGKFRRLFLSWAASAGETARFLVFDPAANFELVDNEIFVDTVKMSNIGDTLLSNTLVFDAVGAYVSTALGTRLSATLKPDADILIGSYSGDCVFPVSAGETLVLDHYCQKLYIKAVSGTANVYSLFEF
jgi:hypothetical protein